MLSAKRLGLASAKVIDVRALIAPHIHDEPKSGYKEIIEVDFNNNTGTVVYQVNTYRDNHAPDHRWYMVAHLKGWTTTRAANAGDPTDDLGCFEFRESIETSSSILIIVKKRGGGSKEKNMAIVNFDMLLPYKKCR